MFFVKKYQHELELQLNSKECQEAFERLKSEYSIFNLYPTAKSLCKLFKPGNKNYADKDKLMSIFLTELHKNKAIYSLINIMFWDSLHALYCQRLTRVAIPQKKELFNRIQGDFFQSLINHDLERLPRKIDINIFLNTKMKIVTWEREILRDKKLIEKRGDFYEEELSAFILWKSKIYPEEMEKYLLDKVYRKIISEIQYDLILQTQIYKRMKQKEWAGEMGISYNAARVLMCRAKMAMEQDEKEERKIKENQNFFVTFC